MAVVQWRRWRLFFFPAWFFLGPIVRGQHKTTCYQIFDLILGLDLVGVGLDLIYRCEGGRQAVPWKKMTTGREVMSVSCGFWFGVMGLLVGLLVAAMVEVFFLSFFFSAVVGGGEWMWWLWVDMDVEVSFCCDFFFLFLLVVVVVGSVVPAVL